MDKKPEKQEVKKPVEEKKTGGTLFSRASPGVVEDMIGRTGTRGGIIQVRVKILDGPDRNKILRRHVKGPIKEGDILMLRETEIEARSLMRAKKGKAR